MHTLQLISVVYELPVTPTPFSPIADYPNGAPNPPDTGLQPGCSHSIQFPPALHESSWDREASDIRRRCSTAHWTNLWSPGNVLMWACHARFRPLLEVLSLRYCCFCCLPRQTHHGTIGMGKSCDKTLHVYMYLCALAILKEKAYCACSLTTSYSPLSSPLHIHMQPSILQHYSGYNLMNISSCLRDLHRTFAMAPRWSQKAIRQKYSSQR